MVEGFFAEITRKRIPRDVFKRAEELETANCHYLEHHNENPKPFIWSVTADKIIEK